MKKYFKNILLFATTITAGLSFSSESTEAASPVYDQMEEQFKLDSYQKGTKNFLTGEKIDFLVSMKKDKEFSPANSNPNDKKAHSIKQGSSSFTHQTYKVNYYIDDWSATIPVEKIEEAVTDDEFGLFVTFKNSPDNSSSNLKIKKFSATFMNDYGDKKVVEYTDTDFVSSDSSKKLRMKDINKDTYKHLYIEAEWEDKLSENSEYTSFNLEFDSSYVDPNYTYNWTDVIEKPFAEIYRYKDGAMVVDFGKVTLGSIVGPIEQQVGLIKSNGPGWDLSVNLVGSLSNPSYFISNSPDDIGVELKNTPIKFMSMDSFDGKEVVSTKIVAYYTLNANYKTGGFSGFVHWTLSPKLNENI